MQLDALHARVQRLHRGLGAARRPEAAGARRPGSATRCPAAAPYLALHNTRSQVLVPPP